MFIKYFVLVTVIVDLILLSALLFFIYRIHNRNVSIDKIHFLVSENDKSISDISKKVKKMHSVIIKFEKLINEEINLKDE